MDEEEALELVVVEGEEEDKEGGMQKGGGRSFDVLVEAVCSGVFGLFLEDFGLRTKLGSLEAEEKEELCGGEDGVEGKEAEEEEEDL